MAIPKLEDNLRFIQNLGDDPKYDNGLTTQEFKEEFDRASLIIQDYINNVLIPNLELSVDIDVIKKNVLLLSGGIMKGNINMNGNRLTYLPSPVENSDAATKEYAEQYANSLTFTKTVTLDASKWVGDNAPYTQTIEVEGILETDNPHYGPVYSGDLDTKLSQKEAFAMIDDLETADGSVTFTCLEDKSDVNVTIQMEVNRNG